ncbi:MAG: adenylate/guanylate cyclase domain-containing protein [SAR324 cluster bacterium]|nr:adenylate/guanylate cyclase domain-containing protein [SAR324 cluster bacterium]
MEPTDAKRRLSAILISDVAGYSRLMGEDEQATLRTLTAHREVFAKYISRHEGRVVNTPGDSILAEFGSVVDAVGCAVEIQRELAERNAELPAHRAMHFRVGINLGDVMVKGDDIYGDGINIAARLEALAEPGGICISGTVYDAVRGKIELEFDSLGEQTVKNIAWPIRTYKVLSKLWAATEGIPGAPEPDGGVEAGPDVGKQPSIAVLPFENLSNDPEQEYFSDGISEDIITDLSRISKLSVVARNSTFAYKGRSVDVRRLGRELGVSYVLEGSVRKVKNRVRVTAQLIEARTGHHLWADRFERSLEDIFAIQDEITREIVTALDVKLVEGEQARSWRRSTSNPKAYDLFLQARSIWNNSYDHPGAVQAGGLFEQAIALDPGFAMAYVGLGDTLMQTARLGWTDYFEETLERSLEMARRALELDESLPDAYGLVARYHDLKRNTDEALRTIEEAVGKWPHNSELIAYQARQQVYAGQPQRAVESILRAKQLSPGHPEWYDRILGQALLWLCDYDAAVVALTNSLEATPDSIITNLFLTATYSAMGNREQAAAQGRHLLELVPDLTLGDWVPRALPYKEASRLTQLQAWLRAAGLPD